MNNNELFMTLISSLASQAWIQLGKIKNPMTDKIEKNLEAASMSIDMIGMLQEKTKNNLEEYESTLLEKTLNDLRMNFVFEKNQGTVEEKNAEPEVSKEPKKDKKQAPKKKKK